MIEYSGEIPFQVGRWERIIEITRNWRKQNVLEAACSLIIQDITLLLGFVQGFLYLNKPDELQLKANHPPNIPEWTPGLQIIQKTIQNNHGSISHILLEDRKESTVLCMPLSTIGMGVIGVVLLERPQWTDWIKDDQDAADVLMLQAAIAIENILLFQSAVSDALTGLFSHLHFLEELKQYILKAKHAKESLCLLIIDLDRFKALNDLLGHQVGNDCLIQVAQILRSVLRKDDIIGRFGGDEFEIILYPCTQPQAVAIAEKIRAKISQLKFGKNFIIHASIGLALYPVNTANEKKLFQYADESMYKAKNSGGNQYCLCDKTEAESSEKEEEQLSLKDRLLNRSDFLADTVKHIDGHPVLRRIGLGSTSEVFLVTQPELNREIALKRQLSSRLHSKQLRDFEEEARLTAKLNHPGVVPVYSIGRDIDGRRYFTMRPIYGKPFSQVLEENKDLSDLTAYINRLPQLLNVLYHVSETIAYAHAQKIFHLDLNAENIIIGNYGEITVIDWGAGVSSSVQKEITQEMGLGVVMHATAIAPEQLPNSAVIPNAKTDVYAMGVLLYECLTGKKPYQFESLKQTIAVLRSGFIESPEQQVHFSDMDPRLSKLCMDSLTSDPDKRPSAEEFSERLGKIIHGESFHIQIVFNAETHPLREEDWICVNGDINIPVNNVIYEKPWQLNNGDHWYFTSSKRGYCFWKIPILGSFRIVCDIWIDKRSTVGFLSHFLSLDELDKIENHGYIFELGVEGITFSKACYRQTQLQVKDFLLIPGKTYRVELINRGRWFQLYLDNRLLMETVDFFRRIGKYIGFYVSGQGSHIRPLELEWETIGLRRNAIDSADVYYDTGFYTSAQGIYSEIEENFPNTLEGWESRIKKTFCQFLADSKTNVDAVLDTFPDESFQTIAKAELAVLELNSHEIHLIQKGLQRFRDFGKENPYHPLLCKADNCDVNLLLSTLQNNKIPNAEAFGIAAEVSRYQINANQLLTSSQHSAMSGLLQYLFALGRWQDAYNESAEYQKRLKHGQMYFPMAEENVYQPLLALNYEKQLPGSVMELHHWGRMVPLYNLSLALHIACRRNQVKELTDEIVLNHRTSEFQFFFEHTTSDVLFQCYIVLGYWDKAEELLLGTQLYNKAMHYNREIGSLLADAGCSELWEKFCIKMQKETNAFNPLSKNAMYHINARFALENRDFLSAAEEIKRFDVSVKEEIPVLVMQILLQSLGYGAWNKDELRKKAEQYCTGIFSDLSQIFLEEKNPVLGEVWPHSLWMPEYRFWLALWLEAKGRKQDAEAVLQPCVDPRFGQSLCQTKILQTLQRLGFSS